MLPSFGTLTNFSFMKNTQLFQQIEAVIAEKHMLNHPFYKVWSQGKLTKEELGDYLAQYYYLEAAFPRFMSGLHARTLDADMRQKMLENLIHEEAGENNHVAQLLLLAEDAFGMTKEKIMLIGPNEKTQAIIKAFEEATTSDDIQEGLAAMIVYKQQVSDVAQTKLEGLRDFYGVSDEESLEFYETHSAVNRDYHQMLDGIFNESTMEKVLNKTRTIRDAFWGFLDGVTTPAILARCEM